MSFARKISRVYHYGRFNHTSSVTIMIAISAGLLLCRALMVYTGLLPFPTPSDDELPHLRRSRKLKDYVDEIGEPLIEPIDFPCQILEAVPLIILVTSSSSRQPQRQAVRDSWGNRQPTYFFLGLGGGDENEQLTDNYVEAKQHDDIVVLDFVDVPANATLKTTLMLRWSLRRCPKAKFVMKTGDDVLVNPWQLREVIKEHGDAQLIGHRQTNQVPARRPGMKGFLPQWLYPDDTIPEFLLGPGYIINGKYLFKIYTTAFKVPLINLEDVYWTYLVAVKNLTLTLTDDGRLGLYQPIFTSKCMYWKMAMIYNLETNALRKIWAKIEGLGKQRDQNKPACDGISKYISVF